MKLQFKTLNQKSLVVEIEETKTVYELKKELSMYPDVGVNPEFQKLIYAGKILADEDKLSAYSIDVKKFLVIMILKQPLEAPPKAAALPQQQAQQKGGASTNTPIAAVASNPGYKSPTGPADNKKDELISRIVGMGYTESDVKRALAASFWNPERAIEYLIEGIPTSPSTPEGETSDALSPLTPFEMFRADPAFQALRNALQQNPEMIDAVIQRIGERNPALLDLITDHQQEFLSMLLEESDDDEEFEDMEEDGVD